MKSNKQAFTLIEMMAVVVIIGILAAVIGPKLFNRVDEAQIVAARQTIATIEKQITIYRFNTNKLPESLRDLVKEPDNVKGWNGPYLDRTPKDPWGNEFEYRVPGNDDRSFDIWSYGADEQEGGEKNDADITSWHEEE